MRIIEYCTKCKGTGIVVVGTGSLPCNRCGGDGQQETGIVDSVALQADVTTALERLKLIMEKLEIKEG